MSAEDVTRDIARAEQQVEVRTLEPRWQRAAPATVTPSSSSLAATISEAATDDATVAQVSRVLSGGVSAWSIARMQLIDESDIYAPAYGRLAFTVPNWARPSSATTSRVALRRVWISFPGR